MCLNIGLILVSISHEPATLKHTSALAYTLLHLPNQWPAIIAHLALLLAWVSGFEEQVQWMLGGGKVARFKLRPEYNASNHLINKHRSSSWLCFTGFVSLVCFTDLLQVLFHWLVASFRFNDLLQVLFQWLFVLLFHYFFLN